MADHERRIDRILGEDYLDDLSRCPTDVVRRMRDDCEEEESGISYARRVLQGRLDMLRAEVARRRDGGAAEAEGILNALPNILADEARSSSLVEARPTRHLIPPAVKYHRREVDTIADDRSLADLRTRPLDELAVLAEELTAKERELSETRQMLFQRIDRLQQELIERYKSGATDVSEVLAPRA